MFNLKSCHSFKTQYHQILVSKPFRTRLCQYRPKGQPRRTTNEFAIRAADIGNSRKHPIWRLKGGGKLTAKGAVLSPERRDFTVLLTKFAFIVTFEEFLVLYSEQSFYKYQFVLSRWPVLPKKIVPSNGTF